MEVNNTIDFDSLSESERESIMAMLGVLREKTEIPDDYCEVLSVE